jgi:hypothetical protein
MMGGLVVARTQELNVMEDSETPMLLSCSSSWNLMGSGAMINQAALSCAGDG